MRRLTLAAAAALAVLVASGSARAQEATEPVAPAAPAAPDPDKLFTEAMNLIADERFAEAIPKLEETQRIDPGIGAQFNLAICYAKTGRLALAWKNFRQVEALAGAAGKKERAEAARAKLDELRPRLPNIAVRVTEKGAVTVRVDGEPIAASELDFIPLAPGEHEVEVLAPGGKSFQQAITITGEDGQHQEIVVPALAPLETKTEIPTVTEETTSTRRTLGYVLGSVGLAGVAAAAVTGILILSDKSTADERCKPDCVTANGDIDSKGADAVQRGKTLLPINIIAWVVAGAGLGAGAFFVITSPNPAGPTPAARATLVPSFDGRGNASALLTTTF